MIAIDFHGLAISIVAPASILDALQDRFAHFPPSEEGSFDLTFEYVVVPELGALPRAAAGWRSFYQPGKGDALYDPAEDECYFESGDGISAACRPTEGTCRVSVVAPLEDKLWLLTHPFVTLPLMEMLKRRGRFTIHAAGAARNGRSILMCGTSGAGKTTLTVALLRAGFEFMSDDLTVLRMGTDIRALAFPEVIDITETSSSFFPELQPLNAATKPPGWIKQRLRIGDYYPSAIAWETVPAAILFPRIANAERSKLVSLSPTAALLELSASVLLTDKRSTAAHLEVLGRLTQSTPCYQLLTGSDFEQIPRLLGTLL